MELVLKWNESPHNKIPHTPPTRGEKRKLYGLETEARGVAVFRSKLINESELEKTQKFSKVKNEKLIEGESIDKVISNTALKQIKYQQVRYKAY